MSYFITWLIVGIVLLIITIFVHKNTYWLGYEVEVIHKLPTPRWLCIVALAITVTPILNVIVFVLGLMAYCSHHIEGAIMFHCESRWWKSLMKWLTKEV